MRHLVAGRKLGRRTAHRHALLAGLVCHLIMEKRLVTTLQKAKAARPLAEKMVTLAKRGTLNDRRRAASLLGRPPAVKLLFSDIAERCRERKGGYVRVLKLQKPRGDGATMAVMEWVDIAHVSKKKPPKQEEAASKTAT